MRLSRINYEGYLILISSIGLILIGNLIYNIFNGNEIFYVENSINNESINSNLNTISRYGTIGLVRMFILLTRLILLFMCIALFGIYIYIYTVDIVYVSKLFKSNDAIEKFASNVAINIIEKDKENCKHNSNINNDSFIKYLLKNKYDIVILAINFALLETNILSTVENILIN